MKVELGTEASHGALCLVGEMVTLSNLLTPYAYDAICMGVNTVARRFLKDVKNLKFVCTDSGPATYCVGNYSWSF